MNIKSVDRPNSTIFSYSPSFSGKRVFAVKLKQAGENMKESTCDAFVTLMDKTDIPLLERIKESWRNTLGGGIISNFLAFNRKAGEACCDYVDSFAGRYKCFAVECPDKKNFSDGVVGLIGMYTEPNILTVDKLHSVNKMKKGFELKGIGSALMYTAARVADSLGKEKLSLRSANDAILFYEKLGMNVLRTEKGAFCWLDSMDFGKLQYNLANSVQLRSLCKFDWGL